MVKAAYSTLMHLERLNRLIDSSKCSQRRPKSPALLLYMVCESQAGVANAKYEEGSFLADATLHNRAKLHLGSNAIRKPTPMSAHDAPAATQDAPAVHQVKCGKNLSFCLALVQMWAEGCGR